MTRSAADGGSGPQREAREGHLQECNGLDSGSFEARGGDRQPGLGQADVRAHLYCRECLHTTF
ncbi:MAG: hypothetical protein ACR2NR_20605 [Solirubrobacteraceae bacterium]